MENYKSDKLQQAIEYERKKQEELCVKRSKPVFHACPPIGWTNDPNGLSCYKNECHLFFQYYPYDTQWGPMHWGHLKSKDMVLWEYLPCAMAPDMEYDGQGCFSGTAIEDKEQHILMYTSVLEQENEEGRLYRQTQSIAVGDGIDYVKLPQNPVIKGEQLPAGSSLEDFRDPKLWKDEDVYYAVIGSKNADGEGQLALFSAEDMTLWKFEGILDCSSGEYGTMWECPDFFPLQERQILIVSPMEMKEEGLEFHEGSNSIYFIGDYDRKKKIFSRDRAYQIDYGPDFYAPETFEAWDGRRIMVGWMQNWSNFLTPQNFEWSGMMTIPRELRIENNRLVQSPVKELENYRVNPVKVDNVGLTSEAAEFSGINGRCLDMTVEIVGTDYDMFWIELAANDQYKTVLTYDRMEKILTIDRTAAGMAGDTIPIRSMYVEEKQLKLRIIMDKYSVEIFANEGRQVMSALLYTPQEADKVRFGVHGNGFVTVEKYEIRAELTNQKNYAKINLI